MKKLLLWPSLLLVFAFFVFLFVQVGMHEFGGSSTFTTEKSAMLLDWEEAYTVLDVTLPEKGIVHVKDIPSKVVILNFWASWCGPCLIELPSLVEFRKKYSEDNVFVLGINGDEEDPELNLRKTEKKYNLNFPSVLDLDQSILNLFKVESLPVTIVFKAGKVVDYRLGTYDFQNSKLRKILEE